MSGGGFHVHGPHDHELEHAQQGHSGHGEGNSSTNKIAMFTAIIATVGAIFAYMAVCSVQHLRDRSRLE